IVAAQISTIRPPPVIPLATIAITASATISPENASQQPFKITSSGAFIPPSTIIFWTSTIRIPCPIPVSSKTMLPIPVSQRPVFIRYSLPLNLHLRTQPHAGFYTADSLIGIRHSARASHILDAALALLLFWFLSFPCFFIRLVLFAWQTHTQHRTERFSASAARNTRSHGK